MTDDQVLLAQRCRSYRLPVEGAGSGRYSVVVHPDSASPSDLELRQLAHYRQFREVDGYGEHLAARMHAGSGFPVAPAHYRGLHLTQYQFIKFHDDDWAYHNASWVTPLTTFPLRPRLREVAWRCDDVVAGPLCLPRLLDAITGHIDIERDRVLPVPGRTWRAWLEKNPLPL